MNSTSHTVLVHGASAVTATADQMVRPDGRHDLAARAGAAATSIDASCAVALSKPGVVAEAIRRAPRVVVPA